MSDTTVNGDAIQTPDLGTNPVPQVPAPQVPEPQVETVTKEEFERLQKELDKERMEKNQLRNKAKKLEGKVLETEDLETIKEAYLELKQKEDDREAAEAQKSERKQAEDFRQKVISEYPKAVQEAAKKLIEKNTNNLTWEDAADWNDARAQLIPQLDALKEVLPADDAVEDDVTVHPNNPSRSVAGKKFEEMSAEEMRKILPIADAR